MAMIRAINQGNQHIKKEHSMVPICKIGQVYVAIIRSEVNLTTTPMNKILLQKNLVKKIKSLTKAYLCQVETNNDKPARYIVFG